MKKTILITGATGLVGSALCEKLIIDGYVVHYLTTRKEAIKNTNNYKGFYWNISSKDIDKNCLKGVSAIIHLAGASVAKRWSKLYKQEIIDSRVASTSLLYQLLKEESNSVKYFVSASGISIYPSSLAKHYTEASEEQNQSFLGKLVQEWENSTNQVNDLGIKVSILRTGIVFGKENSALQKMSQSIQYGLGAALGSGKQYMSWIHLQDMVAAYQFILEKNLEGVYNVVSPNPRTNKEITKSIARVLSRPLWLPNVPSFVLNLLLGEMHEILLESQYVDSNLLEEKGFKFTYENLEDALQDLC